MAQVERQQDGARKLNTEITQALVQAGRRMGLMVSTEYPVPGGRLDVVWSQNLPLPFPKLDSPIHLVGFEVESSWRTRKHVKGDLLNLLEDR